ncbi:MAG TPA: HAD family phosphatase [Ferruginibacter sp.]|nr:HAD family phosphatase [Ferruginibacter sp.]HMP20023.1 HAD family phosphatase [Ferruginibacter sp.]
MAGLKSIIFDLGGVLIDIDYHKTAAAFKTLGAKNFDELYSQAGASQLFEALETGSITEADFFEQMQAYCQPGTTWQQIEAAWNQILLSFRQPSIQHLDILRRKYRIFLLSNTNSIHKRAFDSILQHETGYSSLDGFFEKSYYSHLLHKRKPYVETYQFVLNDGNMLAAETLFIDDSPVNIVGAKEAGLQTQLLLPGQKIETLGL